MCSICGLKLTLRLKFLHFALFCCCLATTHVPNQEININNTVALVEHWCHQLALETNVKSVQATLLHHFITLPPYENGSKFRFSRPWTLLVSYSNYHRIIHDKCTRFLTWIGYNLYVSSCGIINNTESNNTFREMNSLSLILE